MAKPRKVNVVSVGLPGKVAQNPAKSTLSTIFLVPGRVVSHSPEPKINADNGDFAGIWASFAERPLLTTVTLQGFAAT